MTKINILLTFLIAQYFFISGCAHHRNVRPGEDGTHKVIFQTEDKNTGGDDAMSQAEHFCEKQGKYPVVISESSTYNGSMDEEKYNDIKTAGKVASVVGSTAYVFGGKKESQLGGIAALGGTAAQVATGAGYTFEMKFKCK